VNGKLREISEGISTAFQTRARHMHIASMSIKIGLVAIGSLVVAGVQCLGLPADGPWPALSVIGVAASFLVFIGSVFVLLSEQDASSHLASAEAAVRAAEKAESQLLSEAEQYDAQWQSLERSTELYYALMAMRGALERMPLSERHDEGAVIDSLLEVSERSLLVGMGFDISQNYTICVYRSEVAPSGTILRLIAHRRALDCDLETARTWPEGVGAAGMAFARGRELILADLSDPALGTLRDRSPSAADDDADPYQSIVAVPVFIGSSNKKWGVVVATSDVPNHFSHDAESGVRTTEGARALAGMVALALSPNHSSSSTTAS
jgi:hypothetical protein